MLEYLEDFSKLLVSIYHLGFDPVALEKFSKRIQFDNVKFVQLDQKTVLGSENLPLIIYRFCKASLVVDLEILKVTKKHYPSVTILLYLEDENCEELPEVLSTVEIFSVVENNKNISQQFKSAVEYHLQQKSFFQSLDKVKNQNKILEELKINLEDLVLERTKKEFDTHKQKEKLVRETQSILSFIKNVSRVKSVEDLLLHIRGEFKRVHGLMPPILLIEQESGHLRCFYFQGKQLYEKKTYLKEGKTKLADFSDGDLRNELINFLGRPFGTISKFQRQFRSGDLGGATAVLVFEHSIESRYQEISQAFTKQRWPIINMALESTLLKEGLQDIAKLWSKTFNEMSDPILIVDQDFKMSLSNANFHQNRELRCYEAFANRQEACKDCPKGEALLSGEPKTADIRLRDKIYRVHCYPIRLQDVEGASHVINQYVDVTQSIDLQSRVIQGEKMAAVGLLAGNIAHELNNPLTGIHALSELLLQEIEKDSNLFNDLTEVRSASLRCQHIIKDLLEFSDIEEGGKRQEVEVNTLLKKTLPLLKMAMRTLNSDIEMESSELFVKINPQLLQQVLFNLINNACQAMEESGSLYVSTYRDGAYAVIRVRDTGPGIPRELQESIFEPFFTTKEEGKGTGLGLSMSKSVVERVGGTLELNKKLDRGTEFIVKIPVVSK